MTGNTKNALLIASAWVLSANIGAAGAATYTFYADAQGSINESDVGNGTSSGNFYLAGNCGTGCGQGEVRDFFQFDVTGLSGQVVSAELAIDVGNLELDQLDYLTYQVTSLPAVPLTSLTFADLGTGLVYGSRTYTQNDDRLRGVTISLDAAALSAIAAGGFFGAGMLDLGDDGVWFRRPRFGRVPPAAESSRRGRDDLRGPSRCGRGLSRCVFVWLGGLPGCQDSPRPRA